MPPSPGAAPEEIPTSSVTAPEKMLSDSAPTKEGMLPGYVAAPEETLPSSGATPGEKLTRSVAAPENTEPITVITPEEKLPGSIVTVQGIPNSTVASSEKVLQTVSTNISEANADDRVSRYISLFLSFLSTHVPNPYHLRSSLNPPPLQPSSHPINLLTASTPFCRSHYAYSPGLADTPSR